MDHERRRDALATEYDRLVTVLRAASPGDVVTTCADWTVADLTAHLGGHATYWLSAISSGARPDLDDVHQQVRQGVAGSDPLAWVSRRLQELVDTVTSRPADDGCWTWHPSDQTIGFVVRRALHELSVHRLDAQSAVGACQPIEREVAIDGIDEIFDSLVIIRPPTGTATGQTMHLHGTDEPTSGEWLATLTPAGVSVERRHAKGDLAIRGLASDLELVLLGRPPLGEVEMFGDEAVLGQWRRDFRF